MTEVNTSIDEAIAEIMGEGWRQSGNAPEMAAERPTRFYLSDILLVSRAYDYFLVEEEGRLTQLFNQVYGRGELGHEPTITHVETGAEALQKLKAREFDMLVLFNPPVDMDVPSIAAEAKNARSELPVVLVAKAPPAGDRTILGGGALDMAFTWPGDGKTFLGIIQYMEDQIDLRLNGDMPETRCVVLVEGSVHRYSSHIPILYEEIWRHEREILVEELTRTERARRLERRPTVRLAGSYEEARSLLRGLGGRAICLIAEIGMEHGSDEGAGIAFLEDASRENPEVPILALLPPGREESTNGLPGVVHLTADSPDVAQKLRRFVGESLGPTELALSDGMGRELACVRDLKGLEKALWDAPPNAIDGAISDGRMERWLLARSEVELARSVARISTDGGRGEVAKKRLLDSLVDHKVKAHQGAVDNYTRKSYGPHIAFSRIGKGALGGKARGLAFMGRLLTTYVQKDMFPGLTITLPRTLVLCADIYDRFLEENRLLDKDLFELSDERIATRFMQADLPATILGDLRSFVRETRNPLIIRSSGVLEDALFKPFAGVYASMLLPNESWETDLRFHEICSAIKFVFASSFFEKARTYIKTTPNKVGDEKMAVIIQEVVGQKHERYFYPVISGVARSFNHYPHPKCKQSDGVVDLALGLGKTIVDGGVSYRFCPIHPKIPYLGSIKDLMRYSQTSYFAIDLSSIFKIANQDEDASLVKLTLETAGKHGVLDHLASTYSPSNDRLYPGVSDDGPKVLDFAPMLQYDSIPLAKALRLLLRISELSLGCPVEIEFAVDVEGDKKREPRLVILQVRSMASRDAQAEVEIGESRREATLCYSGSVLGNGVMDDIRDIVYVRPESFDMAASTRIPPQIRGINKELMDMGRPYVLIGPGRWGSTDQWLGIPVVWSDIAGSKVIVETPYEERIIDPSQGSHFFHNMISSCSGYFTIRPKGSDFVDWEWLASLPATSETEHVRHVTTSSPLEVRIDGRDGRGIIVKPGGSG